MKEIRTEKTYVRKRCTGKVLGIGGFEAEAISWALTKEFYRQRAQQRIRRRGDEIFLTDRFGQQSHVKFSPDSGWVVFSYNWSYLNCPPRILKDAANRLQMVGSCQTWGDARNKIRAALQLAYLRGRKY